LRACAAAAAAGHSCPREPPTNRHAALTPIAPADPISDACVAAGKPLVSAAAVGTEGQLTVYALGPDGPCYRCLFPVAPAPENCARCADAGVLGVVPGVMGCLQALEAIKVLGGVGEPLSKRLLTFDALSGRFATIRLRARLPGCAACGAGTCAGAGAGAEAAGGASSSGGDTGSLAAAPGRVAATDYAAFTGQAANDGPPPPLAILPPGERLPPAAFQAQLAAARASGARFLLLDVRPAAQHAVMALPGSVNIPYDQFDRRFGEVMALCSGRTISSSSGGGGGDGGADGCTGAAPEAAAAAPAPAPERIFVLCRRGNHSQLAVRRLREAGFGGAVDLVGGLGAWAAAVDGGMPVL